MVFLKIHLVCAAAELEVARQAEGELDQLVVEERLAGLQRDGHAHAVDLDHDVVDEIGLEVEVELAGHVVEAGQPARRVPANGSPLVAARWMPPSAPIKPGA